MLDEKFGPYTNFKGSCMTCYGAVNVVSGDYSKVDRYTQWYNIAHASVVVRPEAVRVGTEGSVEGVQCLVFRNVDGSYGALLLNDADAAKQLSLTAGKHSLPVEVPSRSLVSVRWTE